MDLIVLGFIWSLFRLHVWLTFVTSAPLEAVVLASQETNSVHLPETPAVRCSCLCLPIENRSCLDDSLGKVLNFHSQVRSAESCSNRLVVVALREFVRQEGAAFPSRNLQNYLLWADDSSTCTEKLRTHPAWSPPGWVKPHLAAATALFLVQMESKYHKTLLENPQIMNAALSCLGMPVRTLNLAYLL